MESQPTLFVNPVFAANKPTLFGVYLPTQNKHQNNVYVPAFGSTFCSSDYFVSWIKVGKLLYGFGHREELPW